MIILNGGSYHPESENIDREWLNHITEEDLIGFVPSATTRSEISYLEFFKKQMINYGITNIKMIDLYNDWSIASECRVIYIAGGNTYKLLDIVKRSGFSEFLVKEHRNKIIIGNSAGAVILGRSIKSTNDDDIIGMTNTEGLRLVEYSICPHYTSEKDGRLKGLSKELRHKVIGITENSAIIIDGTEEKRINYIKRFEMKSK